EPLYGFGGSSPILSERVFGCRKRRDSGSGSSTFRQHQPAGQCGLLQLGRFGEQWSQVPGHDRDFVLWAGQISQAINVPILNNGLAEGTKNFHVTLTNASIGAIRGSPFMSTVSIVDNDVGVQFQFPTNGPWSQSPISVAENAGEAVIRVVRGDDGSLPVSVDCYTTDLTATNGLDYTGLSTTLLFGAQERIKVLSIPILNNIIRQPNRTFRLTLANPVGITLGSQRTATVTIIDNDQGFEFDVAS